MSSELELLDQLMGGPLSLTTARKIFADERRFLHAAAAMLSDGQIRLLSEGGPEVPHWKWAEVLSGADGSLEITDHGLRIIG